MSNILIRLATALALVCAPATALAQHHGEHGEHAAMPHQDAADREAVLAVVNAFMDGLAARDAEAMGALVTQPGFLAMVEHREGADRTGLTDMESVIASLASIPVPVEEPIFDPHVMSDGLVAMVWAPYDFLIEGNRSHCGVDIFTLVNVGGEWKITTVTYSHVPAGSCPTRS